MKTLISLTALAVLLALTYLGVSSHDSSRPSLGEAALDFTLVDLDGKEHSVSDHKGRVVVLEWTDYGCPFVAKHYESGNMQKLQETYTARDVVWLSVASGKIANIDELRGHEFASRSRSTAVLLDENSEVAKNYGARTTLHLFIIDADGKLAYRGGIDSIRSSKPADIERAEPYLVNALNEVLGGKPVSVPSTRPYGCPLRY